MEDTRELKQLEKITGVSEKLLNAAIVNHYNAYGVNLAASVNGKIYILNGYYDEIVKEYENCSNRIVDINTLLETKSSHIPFKSGEYVYFLFDGNALVYVGQSVNLAKRIGQHLDCKVFDSVAYVEAEPGYLGITEDVNISFHRPKYNIGISSNEAVFAFVIKRLFA